MELPKNVTQIGEADPHCKIFVEDYVISYIKQLNQYARDKGMAAALYGVRKEEAGITYLFLYGACKLIFLQKECRHLSQAVQQEAEKQRKKYFPDYIFLGYILLDGEMVEGFHVCEQNVCRYIEGYAQFYEKNDSMLAFLLEERKGEAKPEQVSQEKYDVVKKRQEERKQLSDEKGGRIIKYSASLRRKKIPAPKKANLRNMKWTAAAAFLLLCVIGLAAMGNGESMEDLQAAARQLMENMTEKQLPDAVEVTNASAQTGVIVTEDKLTDALLKENAAARESSPESVPEITPESTPHPVPESTQVPTQEPVPQVTPTPTQEPAAEVTPTPAPEPAPEQAAAPAADLIAYTVQRGDTLIGICIRRYGSGARVSEICSLNNITNPDDIKEGEKIFLPQ